MAYAKDDIFAKPLFPKPLNLNLPKGVQTAKSTMSFSMPCPYCGEVVPIEVMISKIDMIVKIPRHLVKLK